MKLGFLLFDYFPFGGLQRDCLKIARLCASRGHEVTIFTRTWQGERPPEVNVELFGRCGFSNVSRNRAWLEQLAHTLPQRGLDGVIGFNKLPGLDVYYGSDPCYAAKVERLKPPWYRWLPRFKHFKALEEAVFAHGRTTQILVLTEQEIPRYEKFYGTERERFHVLPPGIVRRNFTPEEKQNARLRVRREQDWPADEQLLLLVGSGFRVKGLDRAIRSLAALGLQRAPGILPGPASETRQDAGGTLNERPLNETTRAHPRLVVIGQNRPGEFARLARQLGVNDRVHFLGGRHDVFDWLLAADLLFHPAYSEAAGMILLEALAAGLPVLTTDTCGYAFHIERANAGRVLSSPFDQTGCDRSLEEMLASPKRAEWSQNALSYAASNDLYSCHERAVEIIERALATKSAR